MEKYLVIFVLSFAFGCSGISEQREICSKTISDCLYLNSYTRGMNFQVLYLTNNKFRNKPDPTKDYVFENSGNIFFELKGNDLYIYCRESKSIKAHHFPKSALQVNVIEMANSNFMNLFETYKEKELNIFP
jgi:hypothetical protein